MARDPVTQYRVLDASWKLLLVLGLGLLAEGATVRALARARDSLDSRAPENGKFLSWLRRVPLVVARLGLDLLIHVNLVATQGVCVTQRKLSLARARNTRQHRKMAYGMRPQTCMQLADQRVAESQPA